MPIKSDSGSSITGYDPPKEAYHGTVDPEPATGTSKSGAKVGTSEPKRKEHFRGEQTKPDKTVTKRSIRQVTPKKSKKSLKFDLGMTVSKLFQQLVDKHPSDTGLKSFHFTINGFRAHVYDDQAQIAKELVQQGLASYVECPDQDCLEVRYLFPKDFHQRLLTAQAALSSDSNIFEKQLSDRSVGASTPNRITSSGQTSVTKPKRSVKKRSLKPLRPSLPFLTRWAIRLHLKPAKSDIKEIAHKFPIPFSSLVFNDSIRYQLEKGLKPSELKLCRSLEQVGLMSMKRLSNGNYRMTVQRPYDLPRQLEAAEQLASGLPESVMAADEFSWTQALNALHPKTAAHLINNKLLINSKRGFQLSVINQETLERLHHLPVNPIKSDH